MRGCSAVVGTEFRTAIQMASLRAAPQNASADTRAEALGLGRGGPVPGVWTVPPFCHPPAVGWTYPGRRPGDTGQSEV